MKVGFDVDGVLAAFIPAYQQLFLDTTGIDLFHPGDDTNPPCWNWPEHRGYTKAQVSRVWEQIKHDGGFWSRLSPLPGVAILKLMYPSLVPHDIYFITSRVGIEVKYQTETWLQHHLNIRRTPTVCIVGTNQKGAVAKALGLDVYVDDNGENVQDCLLRSPLTRTYLLNYRYNAHICVRLDHPDKTFATATRIDSLGRLFDAELANL